MLIHLELIENIENNIKNIKLHKKDVFITIIMVKKKFFKMKKD